MVDESSFTKKISEAQGCQVTFLKMPNNIWRRWCSGPGSLAYSTCANPSPQGEHAFTLQVWMRRGPALWERNDSERAHVLRWNKGLKTECAQAHTHNICVHIYIFDINICICLTICEKCKYIIS